MKNCSEEYEERKEGRKEEGGKRKEEAGEMDEGGWWENQPYSTFALVLHSCVILPRAVSGYYAAGDYAPERCSTPDWAQDTYRFGLLFCCRWDVLYR